MKNFILNILILLLFNTSIAFASYIDTNAETAVVIDSDSGKILFAKDKVCLRSLF